MAMDQVVGYPLSGFSIVAKEILGDDSPLPVIVEFDLDLINNICQPPEKGEQYENVKGCNFAFLLQHRISLSSLSRNNR
jgi:hypothetical protein